MKLKSNVRGIYQCLWRSFLVMRIALLLILMNSAFAFSSETYAQATKISLRMNDALVVDVFKAIEGQSEFIFFYQDQQVDLNRKVNISAEEKSVNEILDQLFKGTDNVYAIRDRQIVIGKSQLQLNSSLSPAERFLAETQQAKKKEISGSVRDAKGLSLPGATVFVKGTTVGMPTDKDGKFKFSISSDAKILVFSFVGMKSQEVAIGGKTVFNIVLEDESIGLEELVVVGYGVQKKGSVVGAVDKIKPAELKLPTRTVSTSLAGRLAGIIAVQSSGEPGYDGATFWIRGINTFTGTTTPLVLVDGVERSIDGIDPDEIADFTILKDATATAIYGVRGANGVVLVTSKRGVIGKPTVSFRLENGFTSPLQLSKFVDGPTYMNVQNEALSNMGSLPIFTQQ